MTPIIVTVRRICDYCGDTMTPKQAGSGSSYLEADIRALQVGYQRHGQYMACPHCYAQIAAGEGLQTLEAILVGKP